MNNIKYSFGLIGLVIFPLSAFADGPPLVKMDTPPPEQRFSAAPLAQKISMGQKAIIFITHTNPGPAEILVNRRSVPLDQGEYNFRILIHDESGATPPKTSHGKEALDGIYDSEADHPINGHPVIHAIGSRGLDIQSNGSYVETSDISRVFDLKPDHTYQLCFVWKQETINELIPFEKSTRKLGIAMTKQYNISTPFQTNWVTITVN